MTFLRAWADVHFVYRFFLLWLLVSLCLSSFHLKDALITIGEKVCLEVSSCLSLCGFTSFTTDKETVLKGQIQALASPDDPIRRIMGTFLGRQVVGRQRFGQENKGPSLF